MPAVPTQRGHSDNKPADENFDAVAVPITARLGRWQVTMSFWSVFSAMIWMFFGALVASLYGTKDAIAAMVLSVVVFAVFNIATTRLGIRLGLNTSLLAKSLFGRWGATLTALIMAATTLYYAVFESSVVATGFQTYIGAGDIRIWYAVVVLAMLPLMLGSVQTWMAKINGLLLPFYGLGIVAALVVTSIRFGGGSAWLDFAGAVPAQGRAFPGWLLGFILYMGNYILMPATIDFARFAKKEDEKFHERVTFGWVFYLVLIVVNGFTGIYLVQKVLSNAPASENGVVQALIASLGIFGLLFIVVSQTRINTLNYYLSTTNFERILSTYTRFRLPRAVWVSAVALVVFLLMLTNVFSYLETAMTWQGVLFVGWVGVVLTHFALSARDRKAGPVIDDARAPRIGWGLVAWIVPSVVGIILLEATGVPAALKQSAVPIVLILSVLSYALTYAAIRPKHVALEDDKRSEQGEISPVG